MGVDRRVCAVRRPVAVRRRAPRAVACARVAAALQFGVRISATVGAGCARGSRPPGAGGAAALGWSRGVGDMCGVAGLVSRCGPAVRRVPAVATTCGAKRRPGRAGALENQIPKRAGVAVGRRGACRGRRRRGVGRPRSATRTQPSRQPGQRGTEPGGRGRRFQVTRSAIVAVVVAVRVWFVKLK